ncbi:MAG: glycosyltransferase family 4 protein [Pseudomonadota bacterium]
MIEIVGAMIVTFFASHFGVAMAMRYALAKSLIDIPNARSSHKMPTPRGGGVGVVLGFIAVGVIVAALYPQDSLFYVGYISALIVAAVGWLDDRRSLSALTRLGTHTFAAVLVIFAADGLAQIHVGEFVLSLGMPGALCVVLWLVWSTNLFNFMDGSDGLAAQQGIFVLFTMGLMNLGSGNSELAMLMLGTAAALGAFVRWNWAPAKIFMGDVGSGFLGFLLVALAVLGEYRGAMGLAMGLLLNVLFVVDATGTLLRRIFNRENIVVAHRKHLYQRMIQVGLTHGQVAAGAIAINVLFVLPVAVVAYLVPVLMPWILLGMYIGVSAAWYWGSQICVTRLATNSQQESIA